MERKVKATAVVQVTLEVRLDQPWGGDCAIDQLYNQAKVSAIEAVTKLVHQDGRTHQSISIRGEPKVTGILTEEGR